jgi:hypothetical protein
MKKIIKVLIVFFLLINSNAYSQYCNYDSVDFKITLETDTIGVLEVLNYQLSFTNRYSSTKEFIKPWNEKYILPIVEIKYEKDSSWQELPLSIYSYGEYIAGEYFGRDIIELKADSTITVKSNWIDAPFCYQGMKIEYKNDWEKSPFGNFFTELGHYKVRAKVHDCQGNKAILVSDKVDLVVTNYNKIDEQAKKWLENNLSYPSSIFINQVHNNRGFFYYSSNIFNKEKVKQEDILFEFIKLFPNSSFVPWAKLYLASWYLEGYHYKEIIIYKNNKEIRLFNANPPIIQIEKAKYLLNDLVDKQYNNETLNDLVEYNLNKIKANERFWRIVQKQKSERLSNNNK